MMFPNPLLVHSVARSEAVVPSLWHSNPRIAAGPDDRLDEAGG
ncbi:MAG: hypothetical protein QNJ06_06305 [Kiloniellales bacterium]|nr:hypothetical protein [Kiloniellales bacterium]